MAAALFQNPNAQNGGQLADRGAGYVVSIGVNQLFSSPSPSLHPPFRSAIDLMGVAAQGTPTSAASPPSLYQSAVLLFR